MKDEFNKKQDERFSQLLADYDAHYWEWIRAFKKRHGIGKLSGTNTLWKKIDKTRDKILEMWEAK